MQIVIDIHEKDYQLIKNGYISYSVLFAIMNGTPLPKGHRRLIDADKLIKKLEATANIEWNMQVGSSKGLIDAIDIVEDIPTIIKADKEGENEN